jgi:hypothetical protein
VSGARATISFNTPYAAYQHERTDLHHPRGGKAKYLEGPLKQFAPQMAPYIAARVRAKLATERPSSAEAAAEIIAREIEDAIGAFAEIVLGAAQQEAPIEEGTLRASGQVETERLHGVG